MLGLAALAVVSPLYCGAAGPAAAAVWRDFLRSDHSTVVQRTRLAAVQRDLLRVGQLAVMQRYQPWCKGTCCGRKGRCGVAGRATVVQRGLLLCGAACCGVAELAAAYGGTVLQRNLLRCGRTCLRDLL